MKAKVKDKVIDINIEAPIEEIPVELQIMELKQKLADTDYAVIKIAEGSATAEEYSDIIEQRKAWREEINALEAECS